MIVRGRLFRVPSALLGVLALVVATVGGASAARPLLDQHQWDRYFALFARDSNVPWKPTTVRIDTYSSAPVAFSAYAVDTADVIIAGKPRGRALATARRTPVATWRFSPPPGYRVEGNDVLVPLGRREGIFMIQARRGSAVQQVWINRTRIGLVSKEAPEGLLIYGCDLGSGRPLAHMRLLFLTGGTLVTRMTDANGLVTWDRGSRPRFVLAEWGANRAFLSLLPQAPVPNVIAAVRLDRAVVRAGENLAVAGYARRRRGDSYGRADGQAQVTLVAKGGELARTSLPLDQAGAFSGWLHVPSSASGGAATVLASVAGANAGTGVAIEAVGNIALTLTTPCVAAGTCVGDKPAVIYVHARDHDLAAPGVRLNVHVVRYPHILPPGTVQESAETWGATTVIDRAERTNADGTFKIVVPAPQDGLPSTLGVQVATDGNGSSATTRLELPNSRAALAAIPEHDEVDVGRGVAVNVRAFDAVDGKPLQGNVRLRLSHGPNVEVETAHLDAHGLARVMMTHPQLGSNLLLATYDGDAGVARDANSVNVQPRALGDEQVHGATANVRSDRSRYRPSSVVTLDASAPGARGNALISIDSLRPSKPHVVAVGDGHIHGSVRLGDPQGDVRGAIAYVRDGAVVIGSTALAVDGPGHARLIDLEPNATTAAAGSVVRVAVHDGIGGGATTIVRLTEGTPSDGALFDNAGDVLAAGGVTTLVSASDDPPWHAWVTPSRSNATDIFADLGRRPVEAQIPQLDAATTHVLIWRVERSGDAVSVTLPKTPGRYVLSVLRVYDDGDAGGASTILNAS